MTPARKIVAFDVIGTTFSLEPLRDAQGGQLFPSTMQAPDVIGESLLDVAHVLTD